MTGGSTRRAVVIAALVALAGCVSSASPAKQAPSRNDGAGLPVESAGPKPAPVAEVREEPQPSAPVRPFRFPAPVWAELKSGLDVATIVTRGVPEVEIRAVIPGGRAADGERPGVAEITGELLLEGGAGALAGRELLARMEALGGKLAVETTLDATVIRVSAPREALGPALGLLGQVLERPRLGPAALDEVKRRAIAQVRDLARDDARWAALTILHRELYLLRTERHPYSSPASTAAELAKITAADCRAFFQRQFTPARTSIIVAGDVAPDAVRAAAEAAFTARARRDPEEPSLTDPMPPSSLKITLVDRPGSADSEIHLGFLGPARGDRDWVAFEIAGRLLASAAPLDVARGPVPMVAHAAVPAAKTGLAVEGLLAEAERLSTAGPAPEEVEAAAKQHLGALAVRLDSPSALADELARLRLRDLPDDHHDAARRELIDMPAVFVGKVAAAYLRPDHGVLVVAGDAEKIGPVLARFGQVKVVDPIRDFERVRTLSANPEAPLEVPPGDARRRDAPRRPEQPPSLDGATHDYALDPQAAGGADRSWLGRAFVHRLAAADPARPLPILVFLHGINAELIRYRWMGGGKEGDVRRIAAELMESGRVPPFLVAAPSAVVPAATAVARTSWPRFDLDRFLDLTAARLRGVATIDRARVIVAGHSGGGCNASGGIASAVQAAAPIHAALVIDVCMDPDVAIPLARARPTTHVVVSWQTLSWARRPFREFERAFRRESERSPAAPGVLRELEHLRPTEPMPHDAMVPLVLRRWLPALLSADALPDIPCVSP